MNTVEQNIAAGLPPYGYPKPVSEWTYADHMRALKQLYGSRESEIGEAYAQEACTEGRLRNCLDPHCNDEEDWGDLG